MSRRIRNINNNPEEAFRYRTRNGFENDLLADNNDSALFETIGEYMRGKLDLEDVMKDPALTGTREVVKGMIKDYNKNLSANNDNEKFIREIFSCEASDSGLSDEIRFIRKEIDDNKLNDITAEWVKEWHEKKQKMGVGNSRTEEISDFIKGAINSPESEPVKIDNDESKHNSGRSLFVRYSSLAAAALLGAFLLIRTLLPTSDPDKVFATYYKPFYAISPVTRSINNNASDNYSSAIEYYKNGDYVQAANGFSAVLQKDPSAMSSKFLMGLSQLALNNYDQAINMLESVANGSGEYVKEAKWYLGLTYLKTANKLKAAECFEYLAKSDGFYRDRSEKILRRLK
jgi:tetratricopeptide (TPR) repeat protein